MPDQVGSQVSCVLMLGKRPYGHALGLATPTLPSSPSDPAVKASPIFSALVSPGNQEVPQESLL